MAFEGKNGFEGTMDAEDIEDSRDSKGVPNEQMGEGSKEFERNPQLDEKLAEIEKMEPGKEVEITLPEGVDYRLFISKLGEPDRDFEFSGVCDPKTGSVKIVKGYSPESGLFSRAHVDSVRIRYDNDGNSNDIFFHTHTRGNFGIIKSRMKPEDFCKSSSEDINGIMGMRAIEEETNLRRPVVSIIGAGGYISISEANGINFDNAALVEAGVSEDQLLEIKQKLSLEPPVWVRNSANDKQSEEPLFEAVRSFYLKKGTDMSTSYRQKVEELGSVIAPYVAEKSFPKFIDDIKYQHPKYPSKPYLHNIGLSEEQAALVQGMTGVKKSLYKVTEGEGMQKLEWRESR